MTGLDGDAAHPARWLVTGPNGFIGSRVVRTLLAAGHEVRALVQPGTPTVSIDHLPVSIVLGDITQPETLPAAVRGVDVVLHLAAVARDWGPTALFERVNVGGTRAVLEAAIGAGVRRFVLVSSVAVHAYRHLPEADEHTPRDGGALPYGASKIRAEDLVRAAHDEGRIEGVIVRPGLVPFGPRDRLAFAPLARALERGAVPLVDGGRARFTTAYVENLAEGLRLAGVLSEAAGATFLLTDERSVSWGEFLTRVAAALGAPAPRWSVPGRLLAPPAAILDAAWRWLPLPGGPPLTPYRVRLLTRDLVFRSDHARRVLGYRPLVDLDEGIRRTVAWYRRFQAGDPDADRGA